MGGGYCSSSPNSESEYLMFFDMSNFIPSRVNQQPVNSIIMHGPHECRLFWRQGLRKVTRLLFRKLLFTKFTWIGFLLLLVVGISIHVISPDLPYCSVGYQKPCNIFCISRQQISEQPFCANFWYYSVQYLPTALHVRKISRQGFSVNIEIAVHLIFPSDIPL